MATRVGACTTVATGGVGESGKSPSRHWQARYDKLNADYESVQIFFGHDIVANVPVDIIK